MTEWENNKVSASIVDEYQERAVVENQDRCVITQSYSTNLFDLNDDCLLEVLQYVSVSEAFSLLGVFGSRFDEIIRKRIAKLKCLHINLRDPPTFSPTLLQILGRHLKTLTFVVGFSLDSDRCTTQYLMPLCHFGSIQNLVLHYVQFKDDYQRCILNLSSNLQCLDLSFCQLTDDLLRPVLENCLQLREFWALGNYDLKGESFHSIKSKNLKKITLELNDRCGNEVNLFIVNNPGVCIRVYEKGRIRMKKYYQGSVEY